MNLSSVHCGTMNIQRKKMKNEKTKNNGMVTFIFVLSIFFWVIFLLEMWQWLQG
jgi:hypothetical protein